MTTTSALRRRLPRLCFFFFLASASVACPASTPAPAAAVVPRNRRRLIWCSVTCPPDMNVNSLSHTLASAAMADVRQQVAEACRRLAAEGLVRATSGNVSARAGEHVAITPTGGVLAELEAEQIVVVDL